MSGSYGELQNTPSPNPETQIYVSAFLKFFKQPQRFGFIAVNLPAAGMSAVPAPASDKTHHISQRVSQKHADLMRKCIVFRKTAAQLFQRRVRLRIGIAAGGKKRSYARLLQISFQAILSANIQERSVSSFAQNH